MDFFLGMLLGSFLSKRRRTSTQDKPSNDELDAIAIMIGIGLVVFLAAAMLISLNLDSLVSAGLVPIWPWWPWWSWAVVVLIGVASAIMLGIGRPVLGLVGMFMLMAMLFFSYMATKIYT